jgi:hypothetical protein
MCAEEVEVYRPAAKLGTSPKYRHTSRCEKNVSVKCNCEKPCNVLQVTVF